MNTNQPNPSVPSDRVPHPAAAEWMSYLYGESAPAEAKRLAEHLGGCPECRRQLAQWRATMVQLDEIKAPRVLPLRVPQGTWRWAAAAVLLGLGVLLGVAVSIPARARETAVLRQDLRRELQAELHGEWERERAALRSETLRVLDQKRTEENQLILAALRDVSNLHRADYEALQKELESMALTTEHTLWQAQQQIVTLASASDANHNILPH